MQNHASKEVHWLLEEKYQGKITKAAQKDIGRLKAGEPVDYVIGFVEFAGCTIDLSLRPLIPRPETEHWALHAIGEIKKKYPSPPWPSQGIRCLDIFAGSGCVGIAILKHIAKTKVDFAEKEKRFLEQIRINRKKNTIDASRARVIKSDVFSNVKGKYEYIFANPPYVATKRWKSVQSSVKKYEPRDALAGGKNGLRYIKQFLSRAKEFLTKNGTLYLEFDSPQKKDIVKLLKKFGYTSWQFRKDQYHKWRFVVVQN